VDAKPEPIPYEKFRTGYTYLDVYHMIYNRKWKRRNGVLGFWRQLKRQMYDEYLAGFASGENTGYVPSDEPIPD
jgi:hypothetical protein